MQQRTKKKDETKTEDKLPINNRKKFLNRRTGAALANNNNDAHKNDAFHNSNLHADQICSLICFQDKYQLNVYNSTISQTVRP